MRGLKEDHRTMSLAQALEPSDTVCCPSWWKTQEGECVSRKSRRGKSGHDRAWPWNRLYANAGGDCCPDEMLTWIRHDRRSGIGYKGDVVATHQPFDQDRGLPVFVVLMKAGGRRMD